MALAVEMLTQALSGHGRAEGQQRWGAKLFLQVIDPDAFGGGDAFRREVEFHNGQCRANRLAPGVDKVRIPGDRARAHLERTRTEGARLPEEVRTRVSACAAELSVSLPPPIPEARAEGR